VKKRIDVLSKTTRRVAVFLVAVAVIFVPAMTHK